MNEKIQKLAEQAWIETSYPGSCRVIREWSKKLFAELIVRECADVMINDPRLSDVRSATRGCARSIKEHFGVEE